MIAMTNIPSQDNQQEEEDLYKSDPIMDAPSPESEEEAEFNSMDQQGFFFVTDTTKERIKVTTLFWNRTKCQNKKCREQPEEHHHYIFDPDAIAKEYARMIVMEVCSDQDCGDQPTIHSHRPDTDETINIDVPPQILKKIWGIEATDPEPSQINMMWEQAEGVMTITTHIDERSQHDMMAAPFKCVDNKCPDYATIHQHLLNIDPMYPMIPIQERTMTHMIIEGFTCCDSACEWTAMHVHLSKNE